MKKEYIVKIEKGKLWYGIQKYDKNDKPESFEIVGQMPIVSAYLKMIDTESQGFSYLFKFTSKMGTETYCIVENEKLNSGQYVPSELARYGADVIQNNYYIFRECLAWYEQRKNITNVYTYSGIGFDCLNMEAKLKSQDDKTITFKNCMVYKSNKLIVPHGTDKINTCYLGSISVKPGGTAEESLAFYKKEIFPYKEMQMAFLGGAAALIIGFIGNEIDATNPIFHLYGKSSSGKSSTAKAIATLWGKPFSGDQINYDNNPLTRGKSQSSVYGSWSMTERAANDNNAGKNGVSIILNELGKSKVKDLTALLYDLSEGTSKKRSMKNSSGRYVPVQNEGFKTSIVSTGEFSILEKLDTEREGLFFRVMELKTPFTKDAAHAQRIEDGCQKYYGHGANILAAHMLEVGQKAVITIYKKWHDSFSTSLDCEDMQLAGRFTSTFAAPILATAELINAAWGFDIDLDSIKGYLLEYLSEKVQAVDLSKKRFDQIVEICLRNTVRFYARHDIRLPEPTYEKDIWGIIDAKVQDEVSGEFTIWLYKTTLEELCRKYNLPSAGQCMSEWSERGWTLHEKDRLTYRDKNKRPYYVLRLTGLPEELRCKIKWGKEKTALQTISDDEEEDDGTIV